MSHTSQRHGLDPDRPGREMIVLAMLPDQHQNAPGARRAMSELAKKMLEHKPENWLSKNFTELDIPNLGPAQKPLEWLHRKNPELAERVLIRATGAMSTVMTALYTDLDRVIALINDLKGDWLEHNRKKGLPVSIVLSGLFSDVRHCCHKTGDREHTFLHSLGFFGKTQDPPSAGELELLTMCGHGLVSIHRVKSLVRKLKARELTIEAAAHDLARPCVCGIVNEKRAREILARLLE